MTLAELIDLALNALVSEGIPYMVTGSVASSIHGDPRSTNDLDIVIDPSPEALDGLVERLKAANLYVDGDAARTALRERGQFNANTLDAKVDFIVRKHDPFAAIAFQRRRRVVGTTMEGDVVTPEDLILTKLAWAAETGSEERQLRDVSGMIALADELDRAYIEGWAERLGILDEWRRLAGEEGVGS